MVVRVVWWDRDGTTPSIQDLRGYLRDESVHAFGSLAGLRLKLWIADEEANRWGAVYLWESPEAAAQPLPSRASELIGKDPDFGEWFQLEAGVEGAFAGAALSQLGRALARHQRAGRRIPALTWSPSAVLRRDGGGRHLADDPMRPSSQPTSGSRARRRSRHPAR